MKKTIAGLAIAGAALIGASPAFAMEVYSPSAHVGAWTESNDTKVAVMLHQQGIFGYSNYYRTTDSGSYYTLWNKTGRNGSVVYSNNGGRVTDMRACKYIKGDDYDNDECGKWEVRG
ncbi:hypothetical protein [Streptomyces chrestomyceticus]|uniref:Secreted protein n=1 Tax=Streptomyces chrestomyceticus TaxID=68185 RepID=A0ABU7X6X7_9ACTN